MPLETVEWPQELVAVAHEWLAAVDVVATLLEGTINSAALQVALTEQRQATEKFSGCLADFQRRPR